MRHWHLDFETYSEAGYQFDFERGKWISANGITGKSTKKGIGLVGAFNYADHESSDIMCAYYGPKGAPRNSWRPGEPNPDDLLDYVRNGGLIKAHNSFFEFCVWNLIGHRKYGWPILAIEQTRDTVAKALFFTLAPSLAEGSAIMFGESEKDAVGKSVMLTLSQPKNPTKKDTRLKRLPSDNVMTTEKLADGTKIKISEFEKYWSRLYSYCDQDVLAETNLDAALPELSPFEEKLWLVDQRINLRGIKVDLDLVNASIAIVDEGKKRSGLKLSQLTNGAVNEVSEATALLNWIKEHSPHAKDLNDLRAENLQEFYDSNEHRLKDHVRDVVKLRLDFGGNATAKIQAMKYLAAKDHRIRGAIQYCGAQRTHRWAGRGIQPQNMPRDGLNVVKFPCCGLISTKKDYNCCGPLRMEPEFLEWGDEAIEATIYALQNYTYEAIEQQFGNPVDAVKACLRSMLVADVGKEFICSDYAAIEAVVMACMAGEQWVVDIFRGDGKLYERTASKMFKVELQEILDYPKEHNGEKHPLRPRGKVADLAYQYQGARGAALKFGADKFMTLPEIDQSVKAWRSISPRRVKYWKDLEQAAITAVQHPGEYFRIDYANLTWYFNNGTLFCILPNGEHLIYLQASVRETKTMDSTGWSFFNEWESAKDSGVVENVSPTVKSLLRYDNAAYVKGLITRDYFEWKPTLYYYGYNSTTKKWHEQSTYGGKLSENVTQCVSRYILAEALIKLDATIYKPVLHTHDEAVMEVFEGEGSVEEVERIMSECPEWAKMPDGSPWPIKAAGGWRGKRYRK